MDDSALRCGHGGKLDRPAVLADPGSCAVGEIYELLFFVSSANSQLTDSVSQGLAETFQNEPDLTRESLIFLIK